MRKKTRSIPARAAGRRKINTVGSTSAGLAVAETGAVDREMDGTGGAGICGVGGVDAVLVYDEFGWHLEYLGGWSTLL